MMKRIPLFILKAIAIVFLAGGEAPAGNTPATNINASTADVLFALDKQATEAFFKGNAKFFEDMLSDKFVIIGPNGSRVDKAATVQMIAGVKCDIKDGWKLDEPRMSMIDDDTFVLIYRGTFDGTCTSDGNTQKAPSPIRAATVWVRDDNKWLAAFHGENPIFDPSKAPAASPSKPEGVQAAPKKADKAAPDNRPASPPRDPHSDAMMAIEQSVWEAWRVRDGKKLEELTADDLAFVDIFGNMTSRKAETIKFWSEHECDIKSVSVTGGIGTLLSPTVGILTHTGTAEGDCLGQELPPIYGTSVYVKDGQDWKLAFSLNRLP